jgi:hypothetical protein
MAQNISELLRESYGNGAAVGNSWAGLSNWAWPVNQHVFTDSDFTSSEIPRAPEHPDERYITESSTAKETYVPVTHLCQQSLLKNKSPFAKGKTSINKRQKKKIPECHILISTPHKREFNNAKDRKVAKEVGMISEKTVQNKL